MHKIVIELITGTKLSFYGKYRRDLETTNWHYYEDDGGGLHHFRKEHMVRVFDVEVKP